MRLAAVVVCVLGLCASAAAEQPAGAYTIPVNGESGLVFPSGESELCDTSPEGEVCVSTNVGTDSSGAVTGSGLLTLTGDVTGEVGLELAGRVSGSTAKPKVVLLFTAEGTATDGMTELDVAGAGKLKCVLDEIQPGVLACKGKAKLCAFLAGQKVDCVKLPILSELAFERVAFEINLDLVTGVNGGVLGDGNVEIGAIQVATYTAKGKYKPSADTANLALKSDTAAKTKIALKKVVLEAGGASAGTAVFKIAGQKGRAELPSLAPASHPTRGEFYDVNQDTAALFLYMQPMGYPAPPGEPSFDPYAPLP